MQFSDVFWYNHPMKESKKVNSRVSSTNYKDIVIIIPTYNERLNIPNLVKRIFQFAPNIKILFVDDNSPDKTGEYIESLQKKNKRIYLIKGQKKGLGDAYKRGFLYAIFKMNAKYIIQMDADLSHDPKYIRELVKYKDKYDIVIGSRYIKGGSIDEGWGPIRRMNSKFGNLFTKIMLKMPYHDSTSGFKIIKSEILPQKFIKNIRSNGYLFQVEILYFFYIKNRKIKEIPIKFKDRKFGVSKLRFSDIFEYLVSLRKIKEKYN